MTTSAAATASAASAASTTAAASAPFADFARVAGQVGATPKRLEKAALLGEYFGPLADADLTLAARYFAGHTFPLSDQRTTNVGGAALLAAIKSVTGAAAEHLRARLVALGDVGDVAGEAFALMKRGAKRQAAPPLTLAALSSFLEELAATPGAKRKVEMVTNLLGVASPPEAKYVVKLLAGDLRIGLKEGAVEDAIARLAGVEVGRVQWANMLTGDVGETALLARHGQLDRARMRLFHPLKFMLATPAADLSDVAKQMPAEFAVEDKFDGIRAQAHVAPVSDGDASTHGTLHEGRRVALFSRTLDEITPSFPDLVAPLAALAEAGGDESAGLILDGEIVPVKGERVLPFLELQKRLGRKTLPDELLKSVAVAFVAYDLLYANSRVFINEPFAARRARLAAVGFDGTTTRRADSKLFRGVSALDAEFDAARAGPACKARRGL